MKLLILLAFFCSASLALPAGDILKSNAGSRILGGSDAAIGQFPYQVSITMDFSYFCNGALISSTWVLTAGHCVDGYSQYVLHYGSLNSDGSNGGETQNSRNHILHVSYNSGTKANDIGVIELPVPVSFNDNVKPARLPRHSQVIESFAGDATRIAGWGETVVGSSAHSYNLKFVDLLVVTNSECAVTYGTQIRATNLCTSGANGRSACASDSGSLLLFREDDTLYTAIGVASFGANFGCQLDNPSAYTRLTSYLDWIESNTGIVIEQ